MSVIVRPRPVAGNMATAGKCNENRKDKSLAKQIAF